jgi:hypothetical protein
MAERSVQDHETALTDAPGIRGSKLVRATQAEAVDKIGMET